MLSGFRASFCVPPWMLPKGEGNDKMRHASFANWHLKAEHGHMALLKRDEPHTCVHNPATSTMYLEPRIGQN